MNKLCLPAMLSGKELVEALAIYPSYDRSVCCESKEKRLSCLPNIYKLFVPSEMSIEIYNKLYLALLRSLRKKNTKTAIRQQYQNHKAIKGQNYSGIIGGSDSFTIIGTSGIGKSSAVSRAVTLISENKIIESRESSIIPCVTVQCPFDCSVKGLLLEILRKIDETLLTRYYEGAVRARATVDMLIGSVSQAALNHIGILIVDEIQNIAAAKNGRNLMGALIQLINSSGISIAMVGTPECTSFFESAPQLSRRSVGLMYEALKYDSYFESFCKVLFRYQYVKFPTEITPALTYWLYEHSAGNISVVVYLFEAAQEIAILNGTETISFSTLNEAYEQRLKLMHSFIEPKKQKIKPSSSTRKTDKLPSPSKIQAIKGSVSISELAAKARTEDKDIVALLKQNFPVTEVKI